MCQEYKKDNKTNYLIGIGVLSEEEYEMVAKIIQEKRERERLILEKEMRIQKLINILDFCEQGEVLSIPEIKRVCRDWWQKTEEKRWCETEGIER